MVHSLGPKVPGRQVTTSDMEERYDSILKDLKISERGLDDSSVRACIEGLRSRVQLLLGPPGTGKTNTTAAAILLRLLARPTNSVFLLSANTHTAVDVLMDRLSATIGPFDSVVRKNGEAAERSA